MCEHATILGISWWSIWIVVGVGLCLFAFDKLCNIRKVTAAANKFYYLIGVIAIVLGFGSAALVQAIYSFIESGVWSWGGVTFMGGMYGGVISFVVISLIFAKGESRAQFGQICEIGLTCIPIAHAFGRIGCFSVGCCYGAKVTEGDPFAFLGVIFKNGSGAGVLRYPTQLIEAIFLFILAAVMILMIIKNKKVNSVIYFGCYGIFRFALEFLRDDYRGSIGAQNLSPSQVLSILSLTIAVVMLALILINKFKPQWSAAIKHFFRLDVPMPVAVEANEELAENEADEAVDASTSNDAEPEIEEPSISDNENE